MITHLRHNRFRHILFIFAAACLSPNFATSQNYEKVVYDKSDSSRAYYLVIRPLSKEAKGAIVLLSSFLPPEALLPETKLANVASANEMLTIITSTRQKLYADSAATQIVSAVLKDVAARFSVDTSRFALGGYDEAGTIALRYTEFAYENAALFPVQPKAVFAIDAPVDLFGLWHRSEKEIRKNFYAGAVADAKYYLDTMTKENGTIYDHPGRYRHLTPFYKESDSPGNESFLRQVPVRLYYDTDIQWQLQNRRNSYDDTKLADASELIKRLLLAGNDKAEFVPSKLPGFRADGRRHPNSLSIVDEIDCIHWIKRNLGIFDANTWVPPYKLEVPKNWTAEHFSLPPDFAGGFNFRGVEDVRFAPNWGDSTKADYWSYAYLWLLDGNLTVDAASLQHNLQAYYAGLVGRNVIGRKIPAAKVAATNVTVKKVKTGPGDIETFSGKVSMLDYMTGKPIVL
ncbi:MAG TPA: hypothetical protein VEZ17_12840, partial [Chitinophagaceae bacterium]|nr:hypothetical protein [Chitinophagaceae bacterium]